MRGAKASSILVLLAGAIAAGDAKGNVRDLVFTVIDLGGKVQDLQVRQTDTEVHIALAADVLFDFDKDTLKPAAQETLQQAARVIREQTRGDVRIDGHTDAKGDDDYNERLSERRASAVKNWLAGKGGLAARRMATRGLGEQKPVAPNTLVNGDDDPDGRQKNRRVEITVRK